MNILLIDDEKLHNTIPSGKYTKSSSNNSLESEVDPTGIEGLSNFSGMIDLVKLILE